MQKKRDTSRHRHREPPPAEHRSFIRERFYRQPSDWLRHVFYDRVLPNFRDFMAERQLLVWTIALAIGAGASVLAILFRLLIGLVQLPWLGTMSERVAEAAAGKPWYLILLVPAIGGLAVGLVLHYLMPGRRVANVADVIEARALLGCRVPARQGILSAIVSAFSLGVGASAGREGPVVHLGATFASLLVELFRLPHAARRTLLACGVAAAVSASFNAPIAGVLFAHEVILAHYALRAFVPIVISSVAATVIARLYFGSYPAFIVPDYQITSYWEFPAFALLGFTCAVVSIAFLFAVIATDRAARSFDIPLWLRPVIGGLLVGAIGIWLPQILGVGYGSTDAALRNHLPLALMLILIVAKTAATAITLASRFGGGIFSPSLYLGAMTGGAFGLIAASVYPQMTSSEGLYAILGMGAIAAAVLGAPISTVMIVFELTGGYAMTLALLLAVSISTGLTQAVHGMSFFHWQLTTRGVFLREGPHAHIVRSLKVREFMIPASEEEQREPVEIDDETPWLTPDDTVEAALRTFDSAGQHRVVVVDPDDTRKLLGWAEHLDALNAYNRALIAANVEEHR
ncbi:MAG: chloride channel protein [Alphaproteobacteria bacterium]|nr:MAG: chloride channel protein [Alphaproteobacteria bacterium]